MSTASYEFHSPLTLLHQWRDQFEGPRLRELLVTGYTLDLAFFERHCAATARALGARVTVVADAGQASHDPVDVRHAGRSYQHGHATCGGAFHPKLVVLVGDEEVWVAIGSGNPTLSGWGHNHELWLVVRAPRTHGPAALNDLGQWLADLPQVVTMPSWIGDTIRYLSEMITPEDIDGSLPDLRIFGNLRRSILSQLPATSADALRLTAPFFDDRAAAVTALVERFSPHELDIALQPTLTRFDGPAITHAAATVPRARFRSLSEKRATHGKLIEWSAHDSTVALVGSANITAAALLNATDGNGNCELVASHSTATSLLPEGEAVSPADIRITTREHDSTTTPPKPAVMLLGARSLRDAVAVELAANTTTPITIWTSPDGTPGTWLAVHVIHPTSPGLLAEQFRVSEQLGSAFRATVEIEGRRVTSSVVFLTDTARCRSRDNDTDKPALKRDYDTDELFTNPTLKRRFQADLMGLLSQTRPVTGSPGTSSGVITAPATDGDDDRFGTWLDTIESTVGPTLTSLIFPGAAAANMPSAQGWSTSLLPDESELADGEDESVLDELPTQTPQATRIPPSQRQQWRQWASRLRRAVTTDPAPPLELRMIAARLHLDLLAAGVWETSETWRAELRDITQALAANPEQDHQIPEQALSFTHSLIAVCLALLVQDTVPGRGDEADLIARSAWRNVGKWAAHAEPELLQGYLHAPEQPYARVATESEVRSLIDLATSDDPRAETRQVLEAHDLSATWLDGVWIADGTFRNPRRIAAHIATLVESPSVVLARNDHKTSLILRQDATLALAETPSPRWRIYRLSPVSTPLSTLGGDGLPNPRATRPLEPIPAEIHTVATAAEANLQHLLAALRLS